MLKRLDFNRTEKLARSMDSSSLHYARTDARQTAELWDRQPQLDTDGNAGYYRDQATVYAREQDRRNRS